MGAVSLPVPEWLGRVPYREALEAQRAQRAAVLGGTGPEAFWLLEHPAVITTGRRQVAAADLPPAELGIEVVSTERGGLATYHGPGQLVGYLVLDLARRSWRVRCHIHGMEQGLIDWLHHAGVAARRRAGFPGVWVGGDKIAAVGVHVRRGVTLHGFALNLDVDLDVFGQFVPCGVVEGGVTCLARVRGVGLLPREASATVGEAVSAGILRSQRR